MAVVYYDRLYRRKGTRRFAHYLKPRILDSREFDFPVGTVLQWWRVSENIEYVTKEFGYFNRLDRAQVETFFEYPEEGTEGRFVTKSFLINSYITDSARKCKEFKFLKPKQELSVPDKVLKIANYGPISGKYRYTTQPLKDYYIHRNVFSTVIHNMWKTKRRVFITIDLPDTLPTRIELEKISKRLLPAQLKLVPTYKHLNILDMWKFLTPDLQKESILYKIPKDKYKDVDLLLTIDNKLILINLNYLAASVAEYGISEAGAKAKPSNVFKKVFYFMCKKFISEAAIPESELDKHEANLDKEEDVLSKRVDTMGEKEDDIQESNLKVKEETQPQDEVKEPTTEPEYKSEEQEEVQHAGGAMIASQLDKNNKNQVGFLARLRNMQSNNDNELKNTKEEIDKVTDELEELEDGGGEERDVLETSLSELEDQLEKDKSILEDDGEIEDKPSKLDRDINKLELIVTSAKTIDEIKNESPDFKKGVFERVDYLRDNKMFTPKQAQKHKDIIEKQLKSKDPFGSDKTIEEILDYSKDNFNLSKETYSITPNKVVLDESYNNNVINKLKEDYINNQYRKDLVRTIYSLQNAGYIIEDYKVKSEGSITGVLEEHAVKIRTLDGKSNTFKFMLPELSSDGTMKISGQTYVMRQQRLVQILAKIDTGSVKLTTYYGSLFINKATYKKDDLGYKILNQLAKRYNQEDSDIKNLVAVSPNNEEVKLPLDYAIFSRYIKSFNFKTYFFSFDYNKRIRIFRDMTADTLKRLESNNAVLVGNDKNVPILMDFKNRLFRFEDNKYIEIDNIHDLLGLDQLSYNVEFSTVKIFKSIIPTGILLSYYLGFNNLLSTLKTKYTVIEDNSRVPKTINNFVIKFKDKKIVVERDYNIGDLILAGLTYTKEVEEVTLNSLNNKNDFMVLFTKLKLSSMYIKEIKALEYLFLDPMSLSLCKELKLPTNFKGLLIKANELLVDDYYKNPNNISQMCIKGYERICGMVYNELAKGLRTYDNKSAYSKTKISIPPYSIITKINEDSTTVLVDDLNPIAAMKQTEDVSFIGAFGLSKDAMARDSRIYNISEVGIMSEAAKDSGDVGITAYMSAAPNIDSTRGVVNKVGDTSSGLASVVSTSALLAPFSTNDDTKRLNFVSIMQSHTVPVNSMRVPYVRTGYETIIPVRSNEKFVVSAKEDGVVTDLTDKEMTVTYNSKKKATYRIRTWTSKEESETCYTHQQVPNFKKGDKFLKDDSLIYDKLFYEPDIFNPNRVIYKLGDIVTVALMEDSDTYEDSATISRKLNHRLGTTVTKAKSIIVNATDTILDIKNIGSKVEPTEPLMVITDSNLPVDKLDEETIEILKNLKSMAPSAKIRGTISKIEVRYNCELADMSDTLKSITMASNRRLKEEYGYDGKVTSGYSVEGKPLLPGEVQIKVYIITTQGMGIGDKAILGNQCKFTVGEVFDNQLETEDGTDIEVTFSYRGINARIVNSAMLMGTTGMVLEQLKNRAVELYFGK